MLEMAKSSITLFFRGKLFSDPGKVYRQTAIGATITALLVIALAKAGLPLAAAAGLACLIGGALQPYLFKNLKYR
ncbi:hypothetical protein SAMN02927914_06382 [Mesorhizobium qingshengii]|uniref:Uncharacterized protein n=2 Tax=Phyllobacteriaceae TaxID=69277 RepID=A0A1G5ZW92_9HYPH|nr:hypothetical protein MCHK_8352 [Mesorhizobium huakuii 7653R]SDA98900.1 hypothetical protein SAMN02927914_06382 [Mesorhizobium qingshengii]